MGNPSSLDIAPGDFYEDCRYHPMICLEANWDDDEHTDATLTGVSLITGQVGCCALYGCDAAKLSPQEAITRTAIWPQWEAAYERATQLYAQHLPGRSL